MSPVKMMTKEEARAAFEKYMTEPPPRRTSVLLKIQDLIHIAFGEIDESPVNFNIVQIILYIFGRHINLLEQDIDILAPMPEKTTDTMMAETEVEVEVELDPETEFDHETEIEVELEQHDGTTSTDRTTDYRQYQPPAQTRDTSKPATAAPAAPVAPAVPAAPAAGMSIDVMTRTQFEMLKARVDELAVWLEPVPRPSMPDNETLVSDISTGSASLPETMGAMQMNARVLAAEQALARMVGLVAKLAEAGVFPADMLALITQMLGDLKDLGFDLGKMVVPDTAQLQVRDSSVAGHKVKGDVLVTLPALQAGVQRTRNKLLEQCTALALNSSLAEQRATAKTNAIAELKDKAEKINSRLDAINRVASDYSMQLSRFDCGLASQLKSFNEQLTEMQIGLREGLKVIEALQNDSETTVVRELRARYDESLQWLQEAADAHRSSLAHVGQLTDNLKELLEWVEVLGEQKVDRDEVKDALRDKADIKRIHGLLREELFDTVLQQLFTRVDQCAEKFAKQDATWRLATQELTRILQDKAEGTDMQLIGSNMKAILESGHDLMWKLGTYLVSEPKTALLSRKLKNPHVTWPPPEDTSPSVPLSPAAVAPPPSPSVDAVREQTCVHEAEAAEAAPSDDDVRAHACTRWTGGSHTLLTGDVVRMLAPHVHHSPSAQPYSDYAPDGSGPYHLERPLLSCEECNEPQSAEEPGGAADHKQYNAPAQDTEKHRAPIKLSNITLNNEPKK